MGSSDPLPAGFEIRFGSLNFQATGNGYLMRITNHTHGGRPGQDRFPVTPAAHALALARADVAGPSAPRHRQCSGQRSRQARMERRRAARVASQRDATTGEMATAPAGERVVPEPQFPLDMCNASMAYASSASTDVAAREGRPGRHLPAARNLTATTNDESYDGVGLLRCAGPGDVPPVP
jgi:hypothetical protein